MQLTSIIIPTYNGLSLLRACVASIRKHTAVPYEIIVVDNGSTDGTLAYCRRMKLKLVAMPVNVGFPAACNYGLRFASGDVLMLLNNDTIVTPNWLPNLLNCLNSAEDVGMVGPMTNYASGKQKIREKFTTTMKMAKKYNHVNPARWQQTDRLVGVCMLFTRELFEKVGLMDERFSPGHFEDDDLCYRVRLAGYRLLIAGDCFIYHRGSVSYRKQGRQKLKRLVKRNRQKFIDKWGVDPHRFI
ncbi:glycosyl transferase family 2 [Paenibacillus pectinilyticus]|uniref:Glycosyl transferase family 2 n=1 Tax=Paenibacillus pectinilyticus TaxID=512399 RepID=A0A1C1A0S4_9BACL|nr:glycosyltransferase family 2 protein [Paenibacillus pectinilyticus]OCT14002.1 glycosyl transferase family 2 [Paenibacillus pectinilyticus]